MFSKRFFQGERPPLFERSNYSRLAQLEILARTLVDPLFNLLFTSSYTAIKRAMQFQNYFKSIKLIISICCVENLWLQISRPVITRMQQSSSALNTTTDALVQTRRQFSEVIAASYCQITLQFLQTDGNSFLALPLREYNSKYFILHWTIYWACISANN